MSEADLAPERRKPKRKRKQRKDRDDESEFERGADFPALDDPPEVEIIGPGNDTLV